MSNLAEEFLYHQITAWRAAAWTVIAPTGCRTSLARVAASAPIARAVCAVPTRPPGAAPHAVPSGARLGCGASPAAIGAADPLLGYCCG